MNKFIKVLFKDTLVEIIFSIGLVFGLLVVFITPPLQFADEDSHFKKTYLVSTLQFFPVKNDDGQIGNCVPSEILSFIEAHMYMVGKSTEKYSYSNLYAYSAVPNDRMANSCQWVYFSSSKSNPLLYIPQALGMTLGKVIYYPINLISEHDYYNPITMLYFGRVANLLFYLVILSLVVKITPVYKRLFIAIGLMPMTLAIASSLSYDTVVICVCFLMTSFAFRLLFDKGSSVDKRNLIILSILAGILVHLKTVYTLILLLLLLVPKSKFKKPEKRLLNLFVVFGSAIVSFIVWNLISKIFSVTFDDGSQISAQLQFILCNPLKYVEILLVSIRSNFIFWGNSFVGNLGWLDTNFPYPFIVGYYLFIGMTFLSGSYKRFQLSVLQRISFFVIFIAIIVGLETVLYLIWTSIPSIGGVGHPIVSGVQGRYFIPFVILGLLPFSCRSEKLESVYMFFQEFLFRNFLMFSSALMIFILILRYWIP